MKINITCPYCGFFMIENEEKNVFECEYPNCIMKPVYKVEYDTYVKDDIEITIPTKIEIVKKTEKKHKGNH